MNCISCGKVLTVIKKTKKYCNQKCANDYNNKNLTYLSNKLTKEQKEYLLKLQNKFLLENKIKELQEIEEIIMEENKGF